MDTFFLIFIGFMAGFVACAQFGATIAMVVRESQNAATANTPKWHAYVAAAFTPGPLMLIGSVGAIILFVRVPAPPAWSYTMLKGFAASPVAYGVLLIRVFFRGKRQKSDASKA
jgi:hypothetical protein